MLFLSSYWYHKPSLHQFRRSFRSLTSRYILFNDWEIWVRAIAIDFTFLRLTNFLKFKFICLSVVPDVVILASGNCRFAIFGVFHSLSSPLNISNHVTTFMQDSPTLILSLLSLSGVTVFCLFMKKARKMWNDVPWVKETCRFTVSKYLLKKDHG